MNLKSTTTNKSNFCKNKFINQWILGVGGGRLDFVKDLISTNFSSQNLLMLDGVLAYLLAKRYIGKLAGLLFHLNTKILRGNKV